MSGLTWGDLAGGDLVLDVDAAIKHLEWTFEPGDIVHLVNLRPKGRGVKTTVISMGAQLEELIEGMPEEFEGICVAPWSTYYQIAPSTEAMVGKGIRPDKSKCAGTRVLFADLDVGKSGGFKNKAEVDRFLAEIAVPPGSVVWTGSGGAHATWRLGSGVGDRLREELTGRQIGERWWTWLDSECKRLGLEHVVIDRLIDLDARVLRLPGTIRFPKYEGDVTAPVIAEYLDVEDVSYEKFYEITDATFEPYKARVKARQDEDSRIVEEIVDISKRGSRWTDLIIMTQIDEWSEQYLSWEEILTEYGWTKFREGGDGSIEWTRPGGEGKSATTDWPESPGVMSLFSTDPSTGLLDLYEAEIHLTKWRVFLRLIHDDNAWEAMDDLGRRIKGLR